MHGDLKHIVFVYLLAFVGAGLALPVLALYSNNLLWLALGADLIATLIVFSASLLYRNASLYDPYWSVAPFFIALYWLDEIDLRAVLVLSLLALWGVRLTGNWALRWRGLSDIDWRYLDIKEKTGKLYPVANFFAIQLLPTLIVFIALVPVYFVMTAGTASPLGVLDLIAFGITAGAITLQAVADNQLRDFLKNRTDGDILKSGLWRYMRHPNYLGEISFWWGLCFFGLAASAAREASLYLLASPLVMTALFVFASVPLMNERGRARRKNYDDYIASTYALLPLPKAKK